MIQNEDHNQHIIHGSNLWADHRPDQNNDLKARIKAEWPAAICPGIVKGIKDQCFNGKESLRWTGKRRLYSNDSWKRQLCDSGEHGVDDGRAKEGSRTGLRTSNSKRKAFWHQWWRYQNLVWVNIGGIRYVKNW